MKISRLLPLLAAALLCASISTAAQASVRDDIFDIVEAVSVGEENDLLPEPVRAREMVAAFYQLRDYELAWDDKEEINAVLDLMGSSDRHGLDPTDYHYVDLRALQAEWNSRLLRRDRVRARFDVLLTDAVFMYARHIVEGKVDPSRWEESWNYTRRDFAEDEIIAKLSTALVEKNLVQVLRALEPDLKFYQLLQAELKHFRELEQRGDFVVVPEDTVLKPGMDHSNVAVLREKLRRMGLWQQAQGQSVDSEHFDSSLKESVMHFQARYSLDADGIVGRNSFAELNKSYADRIDQVRINLDRIRWINDDFGDDLVIVNIAGFELYLIRDRAVAWETDVMVGTIKNETPMFHSQIKYLVLNPTWTVPGGIKRRSIFPKFSKNPNYPLEHNYKLYNTDGEEVDPLSIDYSQYRAGRFPFRVVQQPGPENALGRVKFIFPNKYAVYLHDTPSRSLFSRSSRAFSSGCIRVQYPLQFAEILLDDQQKWSRANIDKVIEGGKQQVVHLKKPLDVMLMYWTASPTADGGVQFHADVYNRDAKAIAALKEKPHWDAS